MRKATMDIGEMAAQCGFARYALLPAPVPGWISVLITAMPFHWFGRWEKGNAEVSAYYFASQRANQGIHRVVDELTEQGVRAEVRWELPQKPLAQSAGFGSIGKNTLVRNEAWGSCFVLQTLLCDLPPETLSEPMPAPTCGSCRLCMEACPSGAITEEGFRIEKCLRNCMLRGEPAPEAYRAGMGTRYLGCEICQRVCPHNGGLPEVEPLEQSLFAIEKLLRAGGNDLEAIAKSIGRNEARKERLQAQACLAAGNSGDAHYLPLLLPLTEHPRTVIAKHACWAVQRLSNC